MIKEVAKNNGATISDTTDVIETMFEAVRFFMSNPENRKTNTFPIIRVSNFCTFYPAKKYVEHFEEINKEKYKDEPI